MKAEIGKTGKTRKKKDVEFRQLQIEIPLDALELVSSTVLLDLDTTPPDKVILSLGQGVDIVTPGEPSSVVLKEKVYRIRKSPQRIALPPAKSE